MEKAYDLKALGAKLKDKGLDITEDASVLVLESVIDWLSESAVKSENTVDNVVAPLLHAIKPYILSQLDKIDGKEG